MSSVATLEKVTPAVDTAARPAAMVDTAARSATYRAYREWITTPIRVRPVISVVVPAYNEEWRILPTVGAIATHMSSRGEPWELIVADDGSSDTTVELLQDLRFPNMTVLVADRNRGKGSAVRRGVQAARGDYVLFADADQSTPIEQVDRLLEQVAAGYDVAVGSRAAAGAAVSGKSLLRKVLSRGLRFLVSAGFGVAIADTQCGFKLFTSDAARTLFGMQTVDSFSFDLEVLYLSSKVGLRVAEVPVEWIDAPGSTVDAAKVSLQFLVDLVKIRINDFRGRYSAARANTSSTAVNTAIENEESK
ncbi:dolichyl-phosphate beta-glucosyltransferase [Nakamurella sp. GG22]